MSCTKKAEELSSNAENEAENFLFSMYFPTENNGYNALFAFKVENVYSSTDSYLELYSGPTCNQIITTGPTEGSESIVIAMGISNPGTYTFSVKGYDGSTGKLSNCSSQNITYTLNSPQPPTSLTLSSPAVSPGTSATPTILVGGVTAQHTIKLYSNGSCTTEVGSAAATGYDSPTSVNITTAAIGSGNSTFYAKSYNEAGVGSNCSSATVSYVYQIPAPTSLTLISPSISTGTEQTPTIRVGGVLSGATVFLYSDIACTVQLGSASAFSSTVDITSSQLNLGSYVFYAKSTQGAGSSSCSTASVAYTLQAPVAPNSLSLSSPSISPGSDITPTVSIGGVAFGFTVNLYSDSLCSVQLGSSSSFGTTVGITTSQLALGSYTFYSKAIDGTNSSTCSTANVSYTAQGPSAPTGLILNSPSSSPNFDPTPTIMVSGVLANQTIRLYSDNTCSSEVGNSIPSGNTTYITTSNLTIGSYTFYAKAYNESGAGSSCSTASVSYQLDALPEPTSLSMVTPSLATHYSATPKVRVSGVGSADTVRIFSDNTCTVQLVSGSASGSTIDLTSPLLPLGNTVIYANRTNFNGLTSACSVAGLSYTRVFRLGLTNPASYGIGRAAYAGTMADFDNNGTSDLATASLQNFLVSTYSGVGNGTFQNRVDLTNMSLANGITSNDFNGDGNMDIAVSIDDSSNTLRILLGNGNLTFQTAINYTIGDTNTNSIYEVKSVDLNSDGSIDLVVTSSNYLSVFFGNGNGTFAAAVNYPVSYREETIAIGDVNNDGLVDIVTSNFNSNSVGVFINTGSGVLASRVNYAAGGSCTEVKLADLNNDGFLDIAVSNWNAEFNILSNNGNGTFAARVSYPITTGTSSAIAVADIDADGKVDIILGVGAAQNKISIFFGLGNGTFDANLDFPVSQKPEAFIVNDIDSDGDLDIVSIGGFSSGAAEVLLKQ